MRAIHATIRASAIDEAIRDAIIMARHLVEPAEGYGSFDMVFCGFRDEHGRRTLTPTAEADFAYTFWRSGRRGKYKLGPVTRVAERAELRFGLFGGLA